MNLVHTPGRALERMLFSDPFVAFDRLFAPPAGPALTSTDDGYELELALPGLRSEDVEVTLEGGVVTLRAERTIEAPEGYEARRRERLPVRLERSLRLPVDADPDALTAAMSDGVFTLSVPRQPVPPARTVEVRNGVES